MAVAIWDGDTDTTYTTAGNWEGGAAPVATNDVLLRGSNPIDGSDQSGTAIDELLVELGANIGTRIAHLQLDPDSMIVNNSSGVHYLDIGSAAIGPIIKKTNKPNAAGSYGLYLIGSGMTTMTLYGGKTAVAGILGDTATVATARVKSGAELLLGSGTTFTTLYQDAGTVIQECASTTSTVNGGNMTTEGSGAITTLNVYGGTVKLNSSGTITTVNHYGGTIDATGDGIAKTITTYNSFTNSGPVLEADPNIVTITNFNEPTTKFRVAWS